ncbi:MAG TPA: PSD1 and planctomycete cytochrome C domain-containing protein [Rhizomicrobium sp.]|nr:PSD1 and planctomycete cytochrome C domain-containing protein [Rhizomicrobium sp.]
MYTFQDAAAQHVDFNRDIRPIFNSHCITCHGGVKQASDVSFSYREQALGKGKSGRRIVVPGSPRTSELMARVTSSDPETRMPLHSSALSATEIALLREWIAQGAPWENYWAFVPPKPQALPKVRGEAWVRRPLDRFILARLEQEALRPAPEADKAALLRRVSLDLTGLPPTPDELAAFLADGSKDAYEKQVDRLLASPRYGERWASLWLDLARYGDSKGFEKDHNRPGVWTYRDWVIAAFNQNMPYDMFVTKQLAGDLLPDPSLEDLIATSFHRQTQANDEGGTDDEEFRLAAVMDRSATTWSVLNGVSFNCVQCHSHPYDPIRHTEYYKFLAFFNTSRDADIAFDKSLGDDWPVLRVPADKAHFAEADQVQRQIAALRDVTVTASRKTAESSHWTLLPIKQGTVSEIPAIEYALAEIKALAQNRGTAGQIKELQQRLAAAKKEKAPRAGFRIHDGMAEKTGTVPINSLFDFILAANVPVVTALRIEVPPADPAKARHSPEKGFVVNHIDAWAMLPDGRSDKIAFRVLAPDSAADLEGNMARLLRNDSGANPGAAAESLQRLTDNSGFMANPNLFRTEWAVAVPDRPLHLPPGASLRIQLTQTESINAESSPPPRIRFLASGDPSWTAFANAPALAENIASLEQLERRLRAIPGVPLPVMAEQASYERRPTLEFERGSFLTQIGPDLTADTPALFPKLPAGAPRNRLTLAKWFFVPGQPLTARVAVNRYWEQLFGTGIVETLEDFGSAGEMPSHPELLDWLALHFQNDLHWDMKALLRELVTSATYRQSAVTNAALREKDPRNRLLAHGPDQRLTAEMVRDQALLASGLLNDKMGGPPVMPQQPEGIWNTVANNPERWKNATGPDRYRRAIYTYIKRTAIYPSFMTFDAADRQLSLPRRLPTDTPLQALVTLNDPVYDQAARALAGRMIRQTPSGPDVLENRLNYGAHCVLSRDLTAAETGQLRTLYSGIAKSGGNLAGLTAVASALLNLDTALTR